MKTYLLTYQHEGAEWIVELKAKDTQDANARRAKLAYARLDGELIACVPSSMGLLARFATFVKNAL
jgi:hypothetical protein